MIKKILSTLLRKTADDIDQNKYDCSDEELQKSIDLLNSLNTERELSKEQACIYLNVSRSTFDTYIRNGWIPQGKKKLGFKELSWTKSDLDISSKKIRNMLILDKIQ